MSKSQPVYWTAEECKTYRDTVNERMREGCTVEELAFLAGQYTEPFLLYQRTVLPYNYDMDDLKDSAFQQIGVICGCDEPMSLATVRVESEQDTADHSQIIQLY